MASTESQRQSPAGVQNLRDPRFDELDRIIAEQDAREARLPVSERSEPKKHYLPTPELLALVRWAASTYWRSRPCFICSELTGEQVFGDCVHREARVALAERRRGQRPVVRYAPAAQRSPRVDLPDWRSRRALYLLDNGRIEEAQQFLRQPARR